MLRHSKKFLLRLGVHFSYVVYVVYFVREHDVNLELAGKIGNCNVKYVKTCKKQNMD